MEWLTLGELADPGEMEAQRTKAGLMAEITRMRANLQRGAQHGGEVIASTGGKRGAGADQLGSWLRAPSVKPRAFRMYLNDRSREGRP